MLLLCTITIGDMKWEAFKRLLKFLENFYIGKRQDEITIQRLIKLEHIHVSLQKY